jgi:hypothetical protein
MCCFAIPLPINLCRLGRVFALRKRFPLRKMFWQTLSLWWRAHVHKVIIDGQTCKKGTCCVIMSWSGWRTHL